MATKNILTIWPHFGELDFLVMPFRIQSMYNKKINEVAHEHHFPSFFIFGDVPSKKFYFSPPQKADIAERYKNRKNEKKVISNQLPTHVS